MTKALRAAFAAASRLPNAQQDSLAAAILEEVTVEARWDASFAKSGDSLEHLADEALRDHQEGRAEPLDPDKL